MDARETRAPRAGGARARGVGATRPLWVLGFVTMLTAALAWAPLTHGAETWRCYIAVTTPAGTVNRECPPTHNLGGDPLVLAIAPEYLPKFRVGGRVAPNAMPPAKLARIRDLVGDDIPRSGSLMRKAILEILDDAK